MSKKKEIIALFFRIVGFVVCLIGIIVNAFFNNDFMSGASFWYYTIQSNILALVVFALYIGGGVSRLLNKDDYTLHKFFGVLRYVVATDITVTFIVFWILLAPAHDFAYLVSFRNTSVHLIVPLMTIVDAFVFDRFTILKFRHIFLTLVYPLVYFIAVIVRAAVAGPIFGSAGNLASYPYFFLNVEKYGWFSFSQGLGVFYWVLIFIVAIFLLGFGYFHLLRFIQSKKRKVVLEEYVEENKRSFDLEEKDENGNYKIN